MIDFIKAYDIKFESLIVRYRSPKDPNWLHFGLESDSESHLNLGLPSVIFLLGKNGTGKSRFLNGLKLFGNKQQELNPQISLKYSVPTIEEHLEYLNAKESVMQTTEFAEQWEEEISGWNLGGKQLEYDMFNLPFHVLIIDTIHSLMRDKSFKKDFGYESGDAVLDFFGFSGSEIDEYKRRMATDTIRTDGGHPASNELNIGIRDNLNFRDYFAEFFLSMLAGSFVHKDEYDPGPGSFFDCGEFLFDKQERILLVTGIRELFEGTSKIEISCNNGNFYFSLINTGVIGAELRELLQKFAKLRKEHDNLCFPYDLLRDQPSPSSKWLKIKPYGLADDDFGGFRPFSVLDLTFQKREDSIESLSNLFASFVSLNLKFEDGLDYEVGVSGLEQLKVLLDLVNVLLSQVDIGIKKIEVTRTDPTSTNGWLGILTLSTHDFTPIVRWQDSISGKWFGLNSCSDGQLDVLRILISICNFNDYSSSPIARFLLIDEFDRHLHPVVSQDLLSILDKYAKDTDTYVIVSTHSISSLAIRDHTQLFARREFNGSHYLSTERQVDAVALANMLGVPQQDVRKLKKLFVLVEGVHDELIFKHLLATNFQIDTEIAWYRMDGLHALPSSWRNELQYEDADVLIVYDKRNIELEKEWSEIKRRSSRAKLVENLWDKYPKINDMLKLCKSRGHVRQSLRGDTELKKIGYVLEDILTQNENQIKNIKRLHLHGIDVPDIVDCLPIASFPKARKYKTWIELREANSKLSSEKFKSEFDINIASIKKALNDVSDEVHEELQRLFASIKGIIEVPSDWPST